MQALRSTLLIMLPALPLCSCAYHDSSVAETAQHSLIGVPVGDLDLCAGLPTKSEQINPATQLRTYEQNESTNSGINLTFPVIGGGMNFGNGGYCHATFKLVNGQVTALNYAGDTSTAGLPDAVCAPIVRTCVQQQAKRAEADANVIASRH